MSCGSCRPVQNHEIDQRTSERVEGTGDVQYFQHTLSARSALKQTELRDASRYVGQSSENNEDTDYGHMLVDALKNPAFLSRHLDVFRVSQLLVRDFHLVAEAWLTVDGPVEEDRAYQL